MSRPLKIAFWATVAGQLILLLAFVGYKENIIRSGTSVVLQTVPVDPRSLLQGDFAILNYRISRLSEWVVDRKPGDTFYVELREGEDGVWEATDYNQGKPYKDEIIIKGTVDSRGGLDFGIGTYFVPEGTGHIIQRAQDVKVRVALSSGGSAVIEELLVDGEPFDPSRPPSTPVGVPPPQPARPPADGPQLKP